jgi:hypothetical protein
MKSATGRRSSENGLEDRQESDEEERKEKGRLRGGLSRQASAPLAFSTSSTRATA